MFYCAMEKNPRFVMSAIALKNIITLSVHGSRILLKEVKIFSYLKKIIYVVILGWSVKVVNVASNPSTADAWYCTPTVI